MSDDKGVQVTGVRGAELREFRFPNGVTVNVRDGHLFVMSSYQVEDVIAVFAPGKWINVTVK